MSYTATRTGTCQTNSLTPAASSTITHAVSSKSGGNTYTYDCNGNAITRGDQTLIYDEENRLVEVQENSVTVAEYVYDGDGNQVQAVVTDGDLTITSIYIGSYYQQTTTLDESVTPAVETTEWEKYYYAGTVRLAMREDSDDPLYLITDHLGSTSLVINTSGQEIAKRTYLPFGETWGVSATELPTDFTYTGQREAAEIGLKYYVARWYDSEIGHFIQADSVIPDPTNQLSWNRYAYVKFNPMIYVDPSGETDIVTPNNGNGLLADDRNEMRTAFVVDLSDVVNRYQFSGSYGNSSCGLYALAIAGALLKDIHAEALKHSYGENTGIQPSDLAITAGEIYGYDKVNEYTNASMGMIFDALMEGLVVIVDIRVELDYAEMKYVVTSAKGGDTLAHFAWVIKVDYKNRFIYLEDTLNPNQAYWAVDFDLFISAWEYPEIWAGGENPPEGDREPVTRWMMTIEPVESFGNN